MERLQQTITELNDKLKNEIDEARNILYQEEPDFTEEEINDCVENAYTKERT